MKHYKITVSQRKSREFIESLKNLKPRDRKAILDSSPASSQNLTVPARNKGELYQWAKKQNLYIKEARELC